MTLDSTEQCWAGDLQKLARQTPMALETLATAPYLSSA